MQLALESQAAATLSDMRHLRGAEECAREKKSGFGCLVAIEVGILVAEAERLVYIINYVKRRSANRGVVGSSSIRGW